jgi:DNA polymerase-3 subunit delta'
LPHALLFTGPEGVGKQRFAYRFAQSLLCASPADDGQPCGHCRHCQVFQAGNHPDLQMIVPEEGSKSNEIKVDMIRALTEGASLTTKSGGYKLVIIRPADRMNSAAANSLLKTLEEPTTNTVLMLLTDQPSHLLPTIRSRCQRIAFVLPPRDEAIAWLQDRVQSGQPHTLLDLAGGAPLKALAMDDPEVLQQHQTALQAFIGLVHSRIEPVKLADQWTKQDNKRLLQWLLGWVIDILRLKACSEPPMLFNRNEKQTLQHLAERLNSQKLQRFLGQVYEARNLADSNLNPQLMWERLLLEWHACVKQAAQ